MYISEQELLDMLGLSKARLRWILREDENPIYWVKRCGRRVYDSKEANAYVKVIEKRRKESRKNMALRRWLNKKKREK